MVKNKKLILACLLGLFISACSSDPTRNESELDENLKNAKRRNVSPHNFESFDQ